MTIARLVMSSVQGLYFWNNRQFTWKRRLTMQDRQPMKKNLMTTWDEGIYEELWDVAASPHFGGGIHAKELVHIIVIQGLDQLKTEGPIEKELGKIHARNRLKREAKRQTTILE